MDHMNAADAADLFEVERPRLRGMAARILADPSEAEDVVQRAWIRLQGVLESGGAPITNLPAWLTTATTRLCLDQLRARTPVPLEDVAVDDPAAPDPADDVVLADAVGLALQVVLDRLSPNERVAFVLHDSFGFDFPTIATLLGTTPEAARKLGSRARAKVGTAQQGRSLADWEVVDAFLAAAKGGDLSRLVQLLAPDAVIGGDEAAVAMGTPARIVGRQEVAAFFNGAAQTAFPSYVDGRAGAAWIHRGVARVAFDFDIRDGVVRAITFVADPGVLATVRRRDGGVPRS